MSPGKRRAIERSPLGLVRIPCSREVAIETSTSASFARSASVRSNRVECRRGVMALAPGTRLGPYEIGAPIGVGGMGEVYRARDTKLQRDVAIKVLPEPLARDRERLA